MSEKLLIFLQKAPNSYFFVHEAAKLLDAAGFTPIEGVPQNKENIPEKFYIILNHCELAIFDYSGDEYIQEMHGVIKFPSLAAMPNCDDVVEGQQIVRLSPMYKTKYETYISTGLRASGIVFFENENGKAECKLYDSETAIGQIPIIPIHYGSCDARANINNLFVMVDEPLLTSVSKQIGIPEEKITKHKIFFTSSQKPKIVDGYIVASNSDFCTSYELIDAFIKYANQPKQQKAKGLRILTISENTRISTPKADSFAKYMESFIFGSDQAQYLRSVFPSVVIRESIEDSITYRADQYRLNWYITPFYRHLKQDYFRHFCSYDPQFIYDKEKKEPPVFYIDQPTMLCYNMSPVVPVGVLSQFYSILENYISNPQLFVLIDNNQEQCSNARNENNEHNTQLQHKENIDNNPEQCSNGQEENNEHNTQLQHEEDVDDRIIYVDKYPHEDSNPLKGQILKASAIGAGVLFSGFVIYKLIKRFGKK